MSFQQRNRSVDEWYNAVQTQVALAKSPTRNSQDPSQGHLIVFLERLGICLQDNDSNIDLDKCPSSKLRQLAKKMERSKATTRHIKQVGSDLQVVQINLRRHQCTDLPASKHKKRKPFVKPRPPDYKNDTSDRQSCYKKIFDVKTVYKNKERCQKCGDPNHIEGFQCPA